MCRFTAFYNSLPQSLYLSTNGIASVMKNAPEAEIVDETV